MKQSILKILEIVFIILIIGSLIYIIKWKNENTENKKEQEELNNFVMIDEETENNIMENETINTNTEIISNKINVNFNGLKEKNSDTIAYLRVRNTNINYPVVKTSNNDYYLTHTFNKTKNSAGWIFMDYRDTLDSQNIVIYGHNRRDGTMFGQMNKCLKPGWYENTLNQTITLTTEKGTGYYRIFSIYDVKKENYYIQTDFENDDEFNNFVSKVKSRSIKNFDVTTSDIKQILTLSTCINNSKERIVIHAYKIE